MREKPLCRPCLIIEISQVSVNKREQKASLIQYVKKSNNADFKHKFTKFH